LNKISPNDIARFGGKAASLGALSNIKGILVPSGFAIGVEATALNLRKFEKDITDRFHSLKTRHVAVRSSATAEDAAEASFAGQFDTFLNVTKGNLIKYIRKCYGSINSDKVRNYIRSKEMSRGSINIAIVVQKMIQSEISGVAFSVNPVSGNKNEIIVEAAYGLGEYIVSGVVTPDKYIFNKKSLELKDRKINYQKHRLALGTNENKKEEVPLVYRNAQKLKKRYFSPLLKNIIEIERRYKTPMDIEWAIADKRIYITQARPITTLI